MPDSESPAESEPCTDSESVERSRPVTCTARPAQAVSESADRDRTTDAAVVRVTLTVTSANWALLMIEIISQISAIWTVP